MEKFNWDKKQSNSGWSLTLIVIIVLIRYLKILSMIPLAATVINTLI